MCKLGSLSLSLFPFFDHDDINHQVFFPKAKPEIHVGSSSQAPSV